MDGAERVSTLKVVGVVLDSSLTMLEHVSRVLSACASSTLELRLFRTHGLGSDQLHLVARPTTLVSPPSFLMVDFSTVLSLDRLPPMSFPLDS